MATALPWSGVEPLKALDALILGNRGALYEGNIFSVLQHSPFVVRSFEFALADGALDCTGKYPPGTSFADRFWDTDQKLRVKPMSSKLLLFDVKSKISGYAGDQIYNTTIGQQRQVAFYISICAAEPSFVELIPNFYQESLGASASSCQEDNREVAVNVSRTSRMHPSAYKLDPCNAPYRMPIALLLQAIERVRRCAQGKGPYTNPWTLVSFAEWKPLTTSSTQSLKPLESSEHFTAYEAVMEIYRAVKLQSAQNSMALDFVGLQPRLADFKLTTSFAKPPSPLELTEYQASLWRQSLVQHKLDGRDRAGSTPLSNVSVARGQGKNRRWYFSAFDRFDFLLYQFNFSNRPNPRPRIEFFFLPEREIPDVFYETQSVEESFERPNFVKYRVCMDGGGEWIRRMLQIIIENPQPRQVTQRPLRSTTVPDATHILDATWSDIKSTQASGPLMLLNEKLHGRSSHKSIMTHGHRQFYDKVMKQCAERLSGLIVVLARDHPMGDFGFCRYTWTQQEQQDFLGSSISPKTVSTLPPHTPIVPIYYYARDLECIFQGPNLTAPQFRRLNSCQDDRLIVWNFWGPDELNQLGPLVVIPSGDLHPTKAQRENFAKNLAKNKAADFTTRTPLISYLLNSGLFAADYAVGSRGPLVYDGSHWGEIWKLFNQFTVSSQQPQHPNDQIQRSALFRIPLSRLHKRLVQDNNHGSANMRFGP